jgi:hypothetical protein
MVERRSPETFPLLLTQDQRDALIQATYLHVAIKYRLRTVPQGSQFVQFTEKELARIAEESDLAAVFAHNPYKKRLVAVQKKSIDLLEAVSTKPRKSPTFKRKVLQFKITLKDIEPPVWRRIEIPDGPLMMLHQCVQVAFGWQYHRPHQFIINGMRFGPLSQKDFDADVEMQDEEGIRMSDLLPEAGKQTCWLYVYDFDEDWQHEVLFEGHPPLEQWRLAPICREGEQACPPVGIGGPQGYADYLQAMADPNHKRHKEVLELRGPVDPEAFHAEIVTRRMKRLNWRRR